MVNAHGIAGILYDQIIIFRNEEEFKEIVAANPHMKAIIGMDDETKENFPDVYIAGIISTHHPDWDISKDKS